MFNLKEVVAKKLRQPILPDSKAHKSENLDAIALFQNPVESRGIYIPRDSFLIYLAALKSLSIRDNNKFNLQLFGNLDQKASSGV